MAFNSPFSYSAPVVSYLAAKLIAPTYGVCNFSSKFKIQFGQLPGHPVQIMGNIAVSGDMDLFADGNKLIFEVHEYGVVNENCANVGPVFNPLENPYYDTPTT